ncbi:hypothetical protein BD626DRAFT_95459 [Schizophyllum amplum]|uniref:Uncharacterized protein n=1 Tax=Schizophyllum amplum TaxID=97359 RepID=A0A550C8A7_9AGAR|nr:hypothetical protein BD626DRAFT_95459 [Auriculariopsis ampla]
MSPRPSTSISQRSFDLHLPTLLRRPYPSDLSTSVFDQACHRSFVAFGIEGQVDDARVARGERSRVELMTRGNSDEARQSGDARAIRRCEACSAMRGQLDDTRQVWRREGSSTIRDRFGDARAAR